MDYIDARGTAGFALVARRNNSLSSAGRVLILGSLVLVSLTISLAFAAHGAWPVLPFWGLEMVVLFLAFRSVARHAEDFESIRIDGDRVLIEKRDARSLTRYEFNRYWAQLVVQPPGGGRHARLALESHGRQVEFGRHLTDEQRLQVAQTLRQELINH
jgi:uncharacterized membrane protein